MYQELQIAKSQFVESDEESNLSEDERQPGFSANAKSTGGTNSDSEDILFESMFVKRGGSDVCALCELSGGDFARTESGSVVHPQCALFTPETFFKNGVVHGLNLVDPKRQQLKCVICGGRKGQSKVQCAYLKCARAYHVSCAFVNGLLTRDPYYQAWCPRHLKTSGMSQFVEVPDHLNKHRNPSAPVLTSNEALNKTPPSSRGQHGRKISNQRLSHQKKSRNVMDTTPAEAVTVVQVNISSSKSNRKRKRNGSTSGNASDGSVKTARVTRTRGKNPRSADDLNETEPRCARRLDIDLSDESDLEKKAVDAWQHGRDPQHVLIKGSVVEVLARDWRGINKPGGVARVRDVKVIENKNGMNDIFYDIVHIVGAFKEKSVPAQYVRSYQN